LALGENKPESDSLTLCTLPHGNRPLAEGPGHELLLCYQGKETVAIF